MPVTSRVQVTFLWKSQMEGDVDSGCDTDEAAQVQLRSHERKQTLLLSRQEAGCGNKDTEKSKEISLQPGTDKGKLGVTLQKCISIKQWPINKVWSFSNAFITRLTHPLNVSVNIGSGGLRRNSSGYYSNSSEQRSYPTTPGTSNSAFSVYKLPEFKHVKSKIDTGLFLLSHGRNY